MAFSRLLLALLLEMHSLSPINPYRGAVADPTDS